MSEIKRMKRMAGLDIKRDIINEIVLPNNWTKIKQTLMNAIDQAEKDLDLAIDAAGYDQEKDEKILKKLYKELGDAMAMFNKAFNKLP